MKTVRIASMLELSTHQELSRYGFMTIEMGDAANVLIAENGKTVGEISFHEDGSATVVLR